MIDLFHEAEKSGIQVEYARIPLTESISAPDTDGDIVLIDYALMNAKTKERVHLAHELGHCETGSFYNIYTPLDIRQKHENRADKWAINKLVSVEALDAAIADGYDELWTLAEHFNVTEEFMKKVLCLHTYNNLAVEWYL